MIGEIIGWLVVGLIIGALARLIVPGRNPMGCLMTSLLGIAGSIVGGFIGRLIWRTSREPGLFTLRPGWILSLIGAIILLLIFQGVRRSS
jgi:uncharacterized membrane protein YeaQ/YmgE (transglycosylase-associated protein family)